MTANNAALSGDASLHTAERAVAIRREARARRVREAWLDRRRRRSSSGNVFGVSASSTPTWIAPDPALQAEILRREREVLEGEAAQRRQRLRLDRRFPRFYIEQGRAAFDHALVAMEMEETFEQGRRLQMRLRAPYWDSELLAYLYRTPPELLNRGGWSKGLVRESVARRFPSFGSSDSARSVRPRSRDRSCSGRARSPVRGFSARRRSKKPASWMEFRCGRTWSASSTSLRPGGST